MEELTKSIDGLLDKLFGDSEDTVEKSMIKDQKPADTTADKAKAKTPGSGTDDDKRNAGRPKQISDVPSTDTDGKRAKDYDAAIAEKNEDGKKKEDSQVQPPKDMKKSEEEGTDTVSISKADFEAFEAFKKSQKETEEAEALKKAEEKQNDLIKSAIEAAKADWDAEREELKKSIQEQTDLVKAMANKPQARRSISSVSALEKSGTTNGQPSLSPAEQKRIALEVGEELVKSKRIAMEHVIELENVGYIYDEEARSILTTEVNKEIKKRFQ